MSSHLSRTLARAAQHAQGESMDNELERVDYENEDNDQQEQRSDSQSLRDGIQATLHIGSVPALSTTHEHLRLLGASSTSLAPFVPSLSPAMMTAVTTTASPSTTSAASAMPAHAKSRYTIAMLEKSVEDLVFCATPPQQQHQQQPAQVSVTGSSTVESRTRETATTPAPATLVPAKTSTTSSSAVLFRSSSSTVIAPQAPPDFPAVGKTRLVRAPIVGAQPLPSPFASPPVSRPPTHGLRAMPPPPPHIMDESTATMDNAVNIPISLRSAGRRTMLDVVLQRQRSEPGLEPVTGSKKRVVVVEGEAQRMRTAHSAKKAPKAHTASVHALLFPRGIAVDTPLCDPSSTVAPSPPANPVEAAPDLRRSLRHLLPSARAHAAAAARANVEAHHAQQARVQAELAERISDFSDSDDDDEDGELDARQKGMEMVVHDTAEALAAPCAREGSESAMSAFLAQVVGREAEMRAKPPLTLARQDVPRLPTDATSRARTTVSGLLRDEGEERQATAHPSWPAQTGRAAVTKAKASGMPVDALLGSPTEDAEEAERAEDRARGTATRSTVLGLLDAEEIKGETDARRRSGRRRHQTPGSTSGGALIALVDEELFPESSASHASGSPKDSRASSPNSATSTPPRGSGNGRVYLDALADQEGPRHGKHGRRARRVGDESEEEDNNNNNNDHFMRVDGRGAHDNGPPDARTTAEATWSAVCRALNARLNAFFADAMAASGGDTMDEDDAVRLARLLPDGRMMDTKTWWRLSTTAPVLYRAVQVYVLRETNLVCVFGKPPAVIMASLASFSTGGVHGPAVPRHVRAGGGGGGSGSLALPPRLHGAVAPAPPFVGPFLDHAHGGHSAPSGCAAAPVHARHPAPRQGRGRGGGEEDDEDDEDKDEDNSVVARAPAFLAATSTQPITTASEASMVYRVFETFQAVLLGRLGTYTRTHTHIPSTTTAVAEARDESAVDADVGALPPPSPPPLAVTPSRARVETSLVSDVLAWGEYATLATDAVRVHASTRRHGQTGATETVFSVTVRPGQLPYQRLLRRLVDNPTATRVLAYLKDTFNLWQCTPRLLPNKKHRASEDEEATTTEQSAPEAAADDVDGLDVHFCVRAVDTAYGLTRVKGDLRFVCEAARPLFWSAEAARAYSDKHVRLLLAQSQGRGWTLVLPAAVAEAVPLHLDACVYASRVFFVVPQERLIMASYAVTSDAVLTQAVRALDQVIAIALAANDAGAGRGLRARPTAELDNEELRVGREGYIVQKRARNTSLPLPARADSCSSSSRERSPRPATSMATAAVLVRTAPRSQTTTPQRTTTSTRAAYMLSPLATVTASAPVVRGLSVSVERPRKQPREEDGLSPARAPSTTPLRHGFYDPLLFGGLMGEAGGAGLGGSTTTTTTTMTSVVEESVGPRRTLRYEPHEASAGVGEDGHARGLLDPTSSSTASVSHALAAHRASSTISPSLASQRALQSAWAAVDPVGASFPRGPDARWDVPLDVLCALARVSSSHNGTPPRARARVEDEEGLEDISVASRTRSAQADGGVHRGDGSFVSCSLPTPAPQRGASPAPLTGPTRSLSSVPTASAGLRSGATSTTRALSSINSLFPDVFLDSQA